MRPFTITLLPHPLELFQRHTQWPKNLEKQRRADFSATVNGDGYAAAVGVNPALMTSCCSIEDESEKAGYSLKVSRCGARH